MTLLVVALGILSAGLVGALVGAWGAFEWVRRLRPGREGDLLAELAALRASQALHLASLRTEAALQTVATEHGGGGQ